MPTLVRQLLFAWLLATHGALALCGPGHHALEALVGAEAAESGDAIRAENACPACELIAQLALGDDRPPIESEPVVGPAPPRVEAIGQPAAIVAIAQPRAPPRVVIDLS